MDIREPSVTEWDLLSFFCGEPTSRQFGEQWYDRSSVYEVENNAGLKLTFAIHPVHLDVRICLFSNGAQIFDWEGLDVKDVIYSQDKQRELLKILINDTDQFLIQTKPELKITGSKGTITA